MTLRETVFDRCTTHAGTAALIGNRCYPNQLPENVVYPAISFIAPVSANDAQYRTHDNVNDPVDRTVDRVQINCYAETGDDAAALADQVEQAWSGYQSGCDVGYAFIANRISDGWQTAIDIYREIVDVMVEHNK